MRNGKQLRLHPDIGAHIVEDIPFLQDTLPVIRYHQERWDGSGYPIGLRGEDIPLAARIFAVVDAFRRIDYQTSISGKDIARESGFLSAANKPASCLTRKWCPRFEKIFTEGRTDILGE